MFNKRALYWNRTSTKKDAIDLFSEIVKSINEKVNLTINLQSNVYAEFSDELMRKIYNGEISINTIREFVKIEGLKKLSAFTYTHMNESRAKAIREKYSRTGRVELPFWLKTNKD